MATKLVDYYEEAGRIKGLGGKIKLAMLTKMSQDVAESAPDSNENIAIFARAMEQLKAS